MPPIPTDLLDAVRVTLCPNCCALAATATTFIDQLRAVTTFLHLFPPQVLYQAAELLCRLLPVPALQQAALTDLHPECIAALLGTVTRLSGHLADPMALMATFYAYSALSELAGHEPSATLLGERGAPGLVAALHPLPLCRAQVSRTTTGLA